MEHLLELGLHGVKLHPDMQRFALNDPKAMKLYELVGGRVPFLLHTGDYRFSFSNPEQLKPVLEAFPETTFVGAHMGGYTIWKEAARALAGRYDNLYVDISSTFFASPGKKPSPWSALTALSGFYSALIFPCGDPRTRWKNSSPCP